MNILNVLLTVLAHAVLETVFWAAIAAVVLISVVIVIDMIVSSKRSKTSDVKSKQLLKIIDNYENVLNDKVVKEVSTLNQKVESLIAKEEAEVQTIQDIKEEIDYLKMTVVELKAVAKEKGIKGFSTMKKSELIEALKK
jgi:peptidoglycan hydrolase CwlO-like protein